jgi:hypothetical protein
MNTAPAQPNRLGTVGGIVGVCLHHPDRPGVYLRADGTLRCVPCHWEPRVVGWRTVDTHTTCPVCGAVVLPGERVADVDTQPASSCCEGCVE